MDPRRTEARERVAGYQRGAPTPLPRSSPQPPSKDAWPSDSERNVAGRNRRTDYGGRLSPALSPERRSELSVDVVRSDRSDFQESTRQR